jgi:hypothetical protein
MTTTERTPGAMTAFFPPAPSADRSQVELFTQPEIPQPEATAPLARPATAETTTPTAAQTEDDGNADNQPCDNVAIVAPPVATPATETPTPSAAETLETVAPEPPDPPPPPDADGAEDMFPVPQPAELQDFPHPGMDEGADLPGFVPAVADGLLDSVYGDHPHHNDGRHLDGGVSGDAQWQRRWRRIAELPTTPYSVPQGRVGRRFVATLAAEFQGVKARSWNSERPLVFAAVVLQTAPGVKRARDIRKRLTQRMDLWDQGRFIALVDDTVAEVQSRHGSHPAPDDEARARAFNAKVLSGRLRPAVRALTNRDQGGVLQPDDVCSKTGRPVLEVLRGKHPAMRDPDPDLTDPDRGSFEAYAEETPTPVPVVITGEVVEQVASRLSGGAGPGGTDAVDLRNWLLRFGAESESLRDALAVIAEWLANEHPPWAAYRALMACRLVALDKCPGVRPVGIGEVYRRLIAKCVLEVAGGQATTAAGNLNLCAGLPAGIEGAVHALRKAATQPRRPHLPERRPDPARGREPEGELHTQPEPEPMGEEEPDDPDGTLLVDAMNGFNELGRRAMLWTVRHRWAAGSRFAFNCYRHSAQLILRRPGRSGYTLLSAEGVTQGDPLSMVLYGLALVPLADTLRQEHPAVIQAWYADDSALQGRTSAIAAAMTSLQRLGPERGYFPEPAKSIFICAPDDQPAAVQRLEAFSFRFCDGHRYVGGFLGSDDALGKWLGPKIQQWVQGIETLAKVARRYPQTAYAGLTKSLQQEWQYLQRVVPACGAAFEPVEAAIRTVFLPALLQGTEGETQRELTSLSVRRAGLGLLNPTRTAPDCFTASEACTKLLARSLRKGQALDSNLHSRQAAVERRKTRKAREAAEETALAALTAEAPSSVKRRLVRAKETGTWLTTTPNRLNGTELSADEFRDSLRLRLGLAPLNLPAKCDGCGETFSVGHALICKQGGLVTLRHNDVAAEWHHLCARALTPAAVSDEPLIHHSRDGAAGTGAPGTEIRPEIRGDVAVHGFWRRGATAIFDIRVTDTDAPSYRGMAPKKVLEKHEKEKKDKYVEPCLARRRTFTPLVFSVDGLRGTEAEAASKRLASRLAAKWKRTYSEVCGFVRSRLALTLVRTTSLCLRGARDPTARASHATWDTGTGLTLYR